MLLRFLPTSLQYLFASYILSQTQSPPIETPTLTFSLRHELGLTNTSRTVFRDIDTESQLSSSSFSLDTISLKTHRPQSQAAFFNARLGGDNTQQELRWDPDDILAPNVHERENLYLLAKMATNAYSEKKCAEWYDLGPDWNQVSYLPLHPSVLQIYFSSLELSLWLGTCCGWFSRAYLCYGRQYHGGCHHQGDFSSVARGRRTDSYQRQDQ